MKITAVEYFRIDMPLAEPYTIAYEAIHQTSNIILKLTTERGIVGWGCAAPDKVVTGETADDVIKNIDSVIYGLLKNQSPSQIAKLNQEIKKQLPGASSTLAMTDMALYDIMARKANIPLYQLLGGFRHEIPTSITVGIMEMKATLALTEKYLKQGFSIIKLKGGINLNEDIEKVLKLREELGDGFVLRYDANQGYNMNESVEFIAKTKTANIEILEQPTHINREEYLHQVTQAVNVPVMADESLKTIHDAFRLASNGIIDMVNIKLMKVGGLLEAQHINSVAQSAGIEVMIGCLDECALGISAGLHFALSKENILYADLDGHLDLLNDPFKDLFRLEKGVLYPSEHAGLGHINL